MTDTLGVMLNNLERDRLAAFAVAVQAGFHLVHTSALPEAWLRGPRRADYIAAARASGVTIHTMFAGFEGQSYADLPAIRRTVGLVLPDLQAHRVQVLLLYSELAAELGVSALGAHVGFIPHDPDHPHYAPLVEAMRTILDRCAGRGQSFHLETGQEPATVLGHFIQDVGRPNLGVNFDPANMILYGTDEPLTALEKLAPHLRGVHCKDALPPVRGDTLGTEVPLGQGVVPYPALLQRLHDVGYRGPLVIEREHGPHVHDEVAAARAHLEALLAEVA